jgi:serine/threonine-protein kinase
MPRLVPPLSAPMRRTPDAAQQRSDTVAPATLAAGPASRGKKKGVDMRIVWGALAATAVMLPVVLLLLLREGPKRVADAGDGRTASQRPLEVPVGAQPAATAPATAAPAMELTADPVDTAAAAVQTAAPTADATVAPPRPTSTGRMPPPRETATRPEPKKTADPPKKDPPKEDPPAASGGGSGRLLAIASGGSCAFSVDGAGKASGSSLSISLPAGKHTVVCKPSSGAAKSRSVTIKPSETSMLTFKL